MPNPLTPNLPFPLVPPDIYAPEGVSGIDPTSGVSFGLGVANYTPIGTIGTNTVKASAGVFYAVSVTGTGTAWVGTVLDGTATLATGTLSAVGQLLTGSPAGVGIVCKTSILFITTGTAGSGTILWD